MCGKWLQNTSLKISVRRLTPQTMTFYWEKNDELGRSWLPLEWLKSYLDNINHSAMRGKCLFIYIKKNIIIIIIKIWGVPQGSIRGLFLFLLYIIDLSNCLQSTVSYLLVQILNSDLNNIHERSIANKLQSHPPKTKCMFTESSHTGYNIVDESLSVRINNANVGYTKT